MEPNSASLPTNAIYGLLEQMSVLIDNRYFELRRNTRYAKVRPSDVRVFVQVARQSRGETEIAQTLNISRQAVQSSVKRLVGMKLVEVVPMPNNGRNKIVQVSERGTVASATAAEQIRIVEAECASIIGVDELEHLRGMLLHLTTGYKARHALKRSKARPATGA